MESINDYPTKRYTFFSLSFPFVVVVVPLNRQNLLRIRATPEFHFYFSFSCTQTGT